MIKSSFNNPARNNKEIIADEKDRRRRDKMVQKVSANKLAHQIFVAVVNSIDNGAQTHFTKEEMIEMAKGKAKMTPDEKNIWDKACNQAIYKIRAYYWSDLEDATDKRMFNHIKDRGEYWLVDFDDADNANEIYKSYKRKMQGIMAKQRAIVDSLYSDALLLNKRERMNLAEAIKLINGEKEKEGGK